MYSCQTHGWSHLLNPCPSCTTVTFSGSTEYGVFERYAVVLEKDVKEKHKEIAEEICDIRSQIINITEDLAMTRKQMDSFETLKNRLWKVCQKLDAERFK